MALDPRAQSRWDALQASNAATIEKILQGTASPTDIQALSRIIAQQNALAGRVFDEAIAGAEATADTIIDNLNQSRVAGGKRPLTIRAQERLFAATLQRVMREASEDILGAVQDQLEEQRQDIEDHIDDAIDRTRRDQDEGGTRQSLSQRLASLTQQVRNLGNRVGGTAREGIRRISNLGGGPRDDETGPGPDNGGPESRRGIATFVRSSLAAMKNAVVEGWRSINRRSEDDDEDSRATTWLRKLKGFFGNVRDRTSNAASKTKSILEKIFGPIGKILLLALTNPQLIQTITAAISKYLNFDSISDFVAQTWKDIKTGGSDIIDWVINKVKEIFGFSSSEKKKAAANSPNTVAGKAAIATSVAKDSQIPSTTTLNDARAAIPEIESKIKATTAALGRAKERLAKDPSDNNKISVRNNTIRLQILQGQLANYRKVLGGTTSKPADTITKSTAASTGTDTSVAGPGATAGGSPAAAASPGSSTQAVGDFPKFKEGVSFDLPKSTDLDKDANRSGTDAMPSAGVVSLKSFGFQSGDDTLNLLNMGMIG